MTPKQESQLLVNELLPFAKRMLDEFGEFHPFGGKIEADGRVTHVGAKTEDEPGPPQELIEVLEDAFGSEASSGAIRAAAIVVNVAVKPPSAAQKVDAIEIRIDHMDGYSVCVYFPYVIEDGKVTTSPPLATAGSQFAFGERS